MKTRWVFLAVLVVAVFLAGTAGGAVTTSAQGGEPTPTPPPFWTAVPTLEGKITPTPTSTPLPTAPDPRIDWIVPSGGPIGTSFTLQGSNFGTTGTVTFIGNPSGPIVPAPIENWSDTYIRGRVPEGVWTVPYSLYVFRRDEWGYEHGSNSADFLVTEPSRWSTPLELDRNEGSSWFGDPRIIFGEDVSFWAAWTKDPNLEVWRENQQSWQKVASFQPGEGSAFLDPNLQGTYEHPDGGWSLVGTVPMRWANGSIPLYDFRVHTWEDGTVTGGGFAITPLDLRQAGDNYQAIAEGNRFHIAWRNFPDRSVHYARGDNYGYNWTPAVTVTLELTRGTAPAVWASGQSVVVLVDDTHDDINFNYKTWAFVSNNGGASWSKVPVGDGYYPAVAESKGKIVVLLAGGDFHSLFSYVSNDEGQTWNGPYSVSNVTFPGESPEDHRLTCRLADGLCAATYTDDQRIYVSFSTDGGRTWEEPEVVFVSELPNVHPDIALGSSRSVVTWWTSTPDRILTSWASIPAPYRAYLPIIFTGH